MWITLKIGVFYGAPALAVVLALAWLVVLLLRVRRGQVTRPGAALRACWVLALPVAAVVLIWLTGEIAGGMWCATDGHVTPLCAVWALADGACRYGAEVRTGAGGEFSLPLRRAGKYMVRVEAEGFAPAEAGPTR